VPRGTFAGWNLYKAPLPEGELADRDGTHLALASTRVEREQSGDPRLSLAERYPRDAYASGVRAAVTALRDDRLLLEEDAATYMATARN
jgi:hypothetical protein